MLISVLKYMLFVALNIEIICLMFRQLLLPVKTTVR